MQCWFKSCYIEKLNKESEIVLTVTQKYFQVLHTVAGPILTLFPHPEQLFSSHGLCHVQCPYLLSLLANRTCSTETDRENVPEERALDALLFSHFLTYRASTDDVGDWDEHNEGAQEARLAHFLGHLARHVAGTKPRADTDAAVSEASE